MKGKRGAQFFVIVLSFFFVMPILFGLYIAIQKHKGNFEKTVGESSLLMIKTYERGEEILFYLDTAASMSLQDAVYDAAADYVSSYCHQDIDGYPLVDDCVPVYSEDAFMDMVEERFWSRMDISLLQHKLSRSGYDARWNLTDDSVLMVAVATAPLEIDIQENRRIIGTYEANPSFKASAAFDPAAFKAIIDSMGTVHGLSGADALSLAGEKGWHVGYCDTFTDEEEECMEGGGIPIFQEGIVTDCRSCDDWLVQLFGDCSSYVSEDYCNRDACGKGCTWDSGCVEEEISDYAKVCASFGGEGWHYDVDLGRYRQHGFFVRFAFNETKEP